MKLRAVKTEQPDREFYTEHAGLTFVGQAASTGGSVTPVFWSPTWGCWRQARATSKRSRDGARTTTFGQPWGWSGSPPARGCASAFSRAADEAKILFLGRLKVPVRPVWTGHVPLDMDLLPQDNSGTKKERVSYTYKGHDGYGVMAAYLGAEGWCRARNLKPGSESGQRGFGFVLDWVLPYARRLTALRLLLRLDSGHDALENRARAEQEQVDFIIKWNPRCQGPEHWLTYAEDLGHWAQWHSPRPGKRVASFSVFATHRWQGQEYTHRRVMRVVERTIDKKGQPLLFSKVEVEGWWTSLEVADEHIIALYRDHATSEQFHSEFKTDLDLERLPSG